MPNHTRHVTIGPPGFPCMCSCNCPTRHYNLDAYLCKVCKKHVRDGDTNHGEAE
jgi:hypothetical protein